MFVLARYSPVGHHSLRGACDYQFGHLAQSNELGHLVDEPEYLDLSQMIAPFFLHADLWKEVGWDPHHDCFPMELTEALLLGTSLDGRRLTTPKPGGKGFQDARELLITIPTEVSHCLASLHPAFSRRIMRDVYVEAVRQIESGCVRQRTGAGNQAWRPARSLSLGYLHALNKAGEPSLHLHIWTFAPAKDHSGKWRTRDNRAHLEMLQGCGFHPDYIHRNCGRALLTNVLVSACMRNGVKVDLHREFAGSEPRMPHGATVVAPDGRMLLAGSVQTVRQPKVIAHEAIKAILGASPFTERERALINGHQGMDPGKLPIHCRREYFKWKLSHHGFLSPNGSLLSGRELREAWAELNRSVAIAELHLHAASVLSPAYSAALTHVQVWRKSQCHDLGIPFRPPDLIALTEWQWAIHNAMAWAARQARVPNEVPGIEAPVRPPQFLLSILTNAGWIKRHSNGNRPQTFWTTADGITELRRALSSGINSDLGRHAGMGTMHCLRPDPTVPKSLSSAPSAVTTIFRGGADLQSHGLRNARLGMGADRQSLAVPPRIGVHRLSIPGRSRMEGLQAPGNPDPQGDLRLLASGLPHLTHFRFLGSVQGQPTVGPISAHRGHRVPGATLWAHSYAVRLSGNDPGNDPNRIPPPPPNTSNPRDHALPTGGSAADQRCLSPHRSSVRTGRHLGSNPPMTSSRAAGESLQESILFGSAFTRLRHRSLRPGKQVKADYRELLTSMGAFEPNYRERSLSAPMIGPQTPSVPSHAKPIPRM